MGKEWSTYEEVSEYLIKKFANEFGLSDVEGKQKLKGNLSGTYWEIDAKGISEANTGFIVIECRCYKSSKQKQEDLAGLAYRIQDTGAKGGIIVSPLGLQKGAKKVAEAETITEVKITPNSDMNEYIVQFLNKVFIGVRGKVRVRGKVEFTIIKDAHNKSTV